MKLAVLTKIPSPYQVQLFDALARSPDIELRVAYLRRGDADRRWRGRSLGHEALYLDQDSGGAAAAFRDCDFAVFAWYRHEAAARLMRARARAGRPWCFWGERPGFSGLGLLGTAYRRWKLRALWSERRAPVWGIGQWAVEGYRDELGGGRPYFNVPYTCDLAAFEAIERAPGRTPRTLLFSGSLIERKGIAELCAAFARVAPRRPGARLLVLGAGPLEGRLRARAHPAITFLGFRDFDRLAEAYREADVLCAPSRHDGWGLIVPEAMAAAMPVIASTRVGSAREMVAEGENGWLVPPRDVDALEAAIERALACGAGVLERMGGRGRESARPYGLAAGVARFRQAAAESARQWRPSP